MCLVNRKGQSEARRRAESVASKSGFITKKVGTNVNPADLMTKPLARPKIEQLMSLMGFELARARGGVLTGGTETGTVHDSCVFLTSLPDTLWCPVLFVLSVSCGSFVRPLPLAQENNCQSFTCQFINILISFPLSLSLSF